MTTSRRFAYTALTNALDETVFRPLLTIDLIYHSRTITATGLLDSGADVNVLPYGLGAALGLVWEEQRYEIALTGNLANFSARGVIMTAKLGDFSPVNLAFAWSRAEQAPLIFGQTNFFEVFEICFNRPEGYFSITQADAK
ncbi:MAG: hypothetical protein KF716_26350 [Anaerolineae bacterium]|nr:hypothetical protein [Anaerolineae bacterium]